jgi:hypothetical protein
VAGAGAAAVRALTAARADEALVLLLGHADGSVVAAACGALCNVAGSEQRAVLQRVDGIERLADACACAVDAGDTHTATLACRALYNFGYVSLLDAVSTPCADVRRLNNTQSFFTRDQQEQLGALLEHVEAAGGHDDPMLADVTTRLAQLLAQVTDDLRASDVVSL